MTFPVNTPTVDVTNFTSVATTPYGGSTTTVTNTVNAVNEYTAVGATSLVYDANGNLTDDGTDTYEYDFRNRLIEEGVPPAQLKVRNLGVVENQRGGRNRHAKLSPHDSAKVIFEHINGVDVLDLGNEDNIVGRILEVLLERPAVALCPRKANTSGPAGRIEASIGKHPGLIGGAHIRGDDP